MGPFNTPVPKPVTKVQIEGRIIVPGDTPNKKVPKGALVNSGDYFYDTQSRQYVSPGGDVLGPYIAQANSWLLEQIAQWLHFPEGFRPGFIHGVTWQGPFGLSGARDWRQFADRQTAEAIAAGIEAVSGEPVSVVDGRANSWVAKDSEPCWCLYFQDGTTANAGEAARILTGEHGAARAKEYLLELIGRAKGDA